MLIDLWTKCLPHAHVVHGIYPMHMSCSEKYDIILVSPRNYFLYTPLLPAVATGTCEERSIVEPVRNLLEGKVQGEGTGRQNQGVPQGDGML